MTYTSWKAAEAEINVDAETLTVYINPYFLRLNFPHPVLEDDGSSAEYNASSGYLNVTLSKESYGQDFKDLDLLAKLLAPRPTVDAAPRPTIEVIGPDNVPQDDEVADLTRLTEGLSLQHEELNEGMWQKASVNLRLTFRITHQLLSITGGSPRLPWSCRSHYRHLPSRHMDFLICIQVTSDTCRTQKMR
jgi:hypothetical protein